MRFLGVLLLCFSFVFHSCNSNDGFIGNCFVPDVAVNLTINMNLPEFFRLQNLGEYVEFEAGNRGIYVIHNYDDLFYAIERTCTYEPDNECSRVTIDDDILQFRCGKFTSDTTFEKCCSSTYDFNSAFLTGPTRCNLKTYRINRSGNTLFVSN